MDPAKVFFIACLALAFYLVGAIWAHEVDIFRSWKLYDVDSFHKAQQVHFRKLPYWVFTPLGLALISSIVLIWYHPEASPTWGITGNLVFQIASLVLTAIFWGPWQAKLSTDPDGPNGVYLARILRTHWIRTLFINAYAFFMFAWAIDVFAR